MAIAPQKVEVSNGISYSRRQHSCRSQSVGCRIFFHVLIDGNIGNRLQSSVYEIDSSLSANKLEMRNEVNCLITFKRPVAPALMLGRYFIGPT